MRFFVGFLAGMMGAPLLLAGGLVFWVISGVVGEGHPFLLQASGRDLSQAGGVQLVVRRPASVATLICRDGCDDLWIRDGDRRLGQIRVVDETGACVACRRGPLFSGGGPGGWRVQGAPLKIEAPQ